MAVSYLGNGEVHIDIFNCETRVMKLRIKIQLLLRIIDTPLQDDDVIVDRDIT